MSKFFKLLLIIGFFPSSQAFAYRPANDAGQSDTSILQECLWNKDILDTQTECNDLYNHYYPKTVEKVAKSQIRLGSFNIFRSYEQQQKRWDLTARMMNDQWDLIAISELQPNKSQVLQSNVNAAVALREGKITAQDFKDAYLIPSYLVMLAELQKLDPSWALIISPYTQSNADTELFAFAYRASQVDIVESKYCKEKYVDHSPYKGPFILQEIRADDYLKGSGNSEGFVKSEDGQPISDREFIKPKSGEAFACTLALSQFGQDNFNKIPFTAHFKAGDFDFSYISSHLGFRGPYEEQGDCKTTCQEHARTLMTEILSQISDTSKRDALAKELELDQEINKTPAREMVRYFQAYQIIKSSREIRASNDDQDVIISGDFNLTPASRGWKMLMWENLVGLLGEGSELLVETKTSISYKKGLNEEYDHFIFNTSDEHVGECQAETAASFDFLQEGVKTSTGFNLGEEIAKYTDKSNFDELAEISTQQFRSRKWVSDEGKLLTLEDLRTTVDNSDSTDYRSLQVQVSEVCDAQKVEELAEKQWMNIVDAQINETYCKFHSSFEVEEKGKNKGEKRFPYVYFQFVISDHLPIGMTCTSDYTEGS